MLKDSVIQYKRNLGDQVDNYLISLIENDLKTQNPDKGIYGGVMNFLDKFFTWLVYDKEDRMFEIDSEIEIPI